MRLTKLELQGFKSFADRTEMIFEPGVTAIVGPNGCGKSNVSDAVRWVLGEQRARLLRGAKMEEVIFQGSTARRAVSLAEVSLFFENEDGALGIPFREVVITRRLSRSGESEYFLNNSPCRLRDIHDMVRGTGLGADSGVVIESKMVDALLSDRPDERRELFEEAAGVGLYRDRKRTAERRLEETTADLARIDDLITEVQSQVRSLARQRKRAERHSELMAQRFKLDIALATREMAAWRGELTKLEGRVAELRARVPAEEQKLSGSESQRETALTDRANAEASRAELARLVSELRESTQQLRSEIAVATERQRNALSRRERAEEERSEGDVAAERMRHELDRATTDQQSLETALRDADSALAARTSEEETFRAALIDARSALEQKEHGLRDLREQFHRITLDRESGERERSEVAGRRATLEAEVTHLFDAAEAARRELAEAEDAAAVAAARAAESSAEAERARNALHQAREREAAARAELARTEELHTAVEGRLNALEGLERERVGLAPAATRLLKERAMFEEGAILGPLSDYLTTDSAAASLVERFLGPMVNAILVRDRAAAEAVRLWHASVAPGPLLLLPMDSVAPSAADSGDDLASLVSSDAPSRGWVRALLGKVTAVEGGNAFIDARGAIWLPGDNAGPGPLRRRAEIAELRQSAANSAQAREAAVIEVEKDRAALAVAERAAAAAEEAAIVAARESAEASDRSVAHRRTHQRTTREAAEAKALIERLVERESAASARVTSLDEKATELQELTTAQEKFVETARETLTASEKRHDQAREHRTSAQGRKNAIRERLEAEWKKPLEDLLRSAEPMEIDDETLRADAEDARNQLEALGPVNPLAIEEHDEETKRLEFLATQRADLYSARGSLQQAIREIDTTARELFLAAFVKVRENFRNIFITLFGGGECDLRLENPEYPLEGDIEIHASPRGKRTQRIHLLSSGERALVALSLLFGIFLTKPSPFCLLDEVDAPLDDQNIGHFVRMLNRFKDKTQFIVITHNPRTTTEAADSVYGVTMQEPGVSSLVSVRMRGPTVDGAAPAPRAEVTAGAGA